MIWAGGEKRLCYSVIMNSVRLAHSGASVCVCIGTLMEMKQSRGQISPPGYLLTVLLTVMSTEQVGWDTEITKLGHLRGGAQMRQWQIVKRSQTPCSSDEEVRRAQAYTHILYNSRSNLETQACTADCSALLSLHRYTQTPGAIRQMRSQLRWRNDNDGGANITLSDTNITLLTHDPFKSGRTVGKKWLWYLGLHFKQTVSCSWCEAFVSIQSDRAKSWHE